MDDNRTDQPGGKGPANDNGPKPDEDEDGDTAPSQRLDRLVLDMARLIGRQMARDDFERLRRSAANDNDRPRSAGDDGDGATED